jgi:endonuclease/exonuclease/phosphatase family metal-dependent hydrolase
MRGAFPALFACLALATLPRAEEITLVSYNLLSFPGSTGAQRAPYFRTVLSGLGADVLAAQEVNGQSGLDYFRVNVLDVMEPGAWSSGPFHDGYDTDRALYYRNGTVDVLGYGWLDTALRDIDWWDLSLAESGEEFRIYSLHLKAGTAGSDILQRLGECQILRGSLDTLEAGLPFVVTGDFNTYTAAETGYVHLTSPGSGELFDPIDQEGDWHDNAAFEPIHTQSTRTASFGGGATGGMDDRFDLLLVGEEMLDGLGLELDPETYTAYGNDGAHFNLSIIEGGNGAVPADVAEALYQSSDHLPVFAVLRVEPATAVAGAIPAAGDLRVQPSPFNAHTSIRFAVERPGNVLLALHDAAGRVVATLASGFVPAGTLERTWDGRDAAGRDAASGVYFARLTADGRSAVARLVLIR